MAQVRQMKLDDTEPAWDIALLYPEQGEWTEFDYLELTDSTNRLVELSDGRLEVLPMPTTSHQRIVLFLHGLLSSFIGRSKVGQVLIAPLRVRLWSKKFCEPDVIFMLSKHASRIGEQFWQGADLVMEVVSPSPDARKRDLVEKKRDYARAGISEYWIIDPKEARILVLKLKAKRYVVHADAAVGERAESMLLRGFSIDVDDAMAAARREV
jgi:Uma2 family endonuclease